VLVEGAAADLEQQIARLSALRDEIAAAVAAHDAAEDAKLASLVKIYETMKPKAAAEIFDRLEMPVLIEVIERMREVKSADVLARMNPVKAKQVTSELARRSELLEASRDARDTASQSNGS
jgi:flagellar motility protein MotE (MotC chaperone)